MVIDRYAFFLQVFLLLTDYICLAGWGSQVKHGSRVGSASMSMTPDMALRRVDRRTRVAASFQSRV